MSLFDMRQSLVVGVCKKQEASLTITQAAHSGAYPKIVLPLGKHLTYVRPGEWQQKDFHLSDQFLSNTRT